MLFYTSNHSKKDRPFYFFYTQVSMPGQVKLSAPCEKSCATVFSLIANLSHILACIALTRPDLNRAVVVMQSFSLQHLVSISSGIGLHLPHTYQSTTCWPSEESGSVERRTVVTASTVALELHSLESTSEEGSTFRSSSMIRRVWMYGCSLKRAVIIWFKQIIKSAGL